MGVKNTLNYMSDALKHADKKEVNSRIKQLRKSLSLTQAQFAEKLEKGQDYISMCETNRRNASLNLVDAICDKFGVSPQWLIEGKGFMYDDIIDGIDTNNEHLTRLISKMLELDADQLEHLEPIIDSCIAIANHKKSE